MVLNRKNYLTGIEWTGRLHHTGPPHLVYLRQHLRHPMLATNYT